MYIDVILWDVDDTLLDFAYSQTYALSKCLEEIGIIPTEEMVARYDSINISWWKRLERGEVTREELLLGRFREFFTCYGIDKEITPFMNSYQEKLGSVYHYVENSLEICKSLKGKCRQYAVTNGVTHTQVNKLTLAGFTDVLDDIFVSGQIGAPKPNRRFFEAVFEKIPDVPKQKIMIVGDSLSSDIRGGNNAGIRTCWYNPENLINNTEAEVDFMITHLKEVPLIVEG